MLKGGRSGGLGAWRGRSFDSAVGHLHAGGASQLVCTADERHMRRVAASKEALSAFGLLLNSGIQRETPNRRFGLRRQPRLRLSVIMPRHEKRPSVRKVRGALCGASVWLRAARCCTGMLHALHERGPIGVAHDA